MRVKELFDVECNICGRHLKDFGGEICIDEDEAIELAEMQGWKFYKEKNENACPLCARDIASEGMVFKGLPDYCYSTLALNGEVIMIKKGESGYYQLKQTDLTADKINEKLGITKAQEQAMKVGSMFGWHVQGANPLNYDEEGKLIKKDK